ncbi:MAG: hypothetical protein ROZ00_02930 [Denitratisoma sp.]|nr:hypothetical protein [Denitratisoma sp.]
MTTQLIRAYETIDQTTLEDFYMAVAKSIEKSLIQAGATPGTDYTFLDLYKLAQPFVLETFKKEGALSVPASWA